MTFGLGRREAETEEERLRPVLAMLGGSLEVLCSDMDNDKQINDPYHGRFMKGWRMNVFWTWELDGCGLDVVGFRV